MKVFFGYGYGTRVKVSGMDLANWRLLRRVKLWQRRCEREGRPSSDLLRVCRVVMEKQVTKMVSGRRFSFFLFFCMDFCVRVRWRKERVFVSVLLC